MDTKTKDSINDLRFSIYAYDRRLCSGSMRSIMIYAKKLINISNIQELINEFNLISSDKIDVEKALSYIKDAREKVKSKNIDRDSHPILAKFDAVLKEHSNHLKTKSEEHFNSIRNEFVEANKICQIDAYGYARKLAEIKYDATKNQMARSQYEWNITLAISNNPVYQLIRSLSFAYNDDIKWNEWLNKKTDEIIRANKFKLYSVVLKKLKGLDIETIEDQWVHTGNQGFEGNFTLILKNNVKKYLNVRSIYAGGYNIQCLHYRFLAKVK